MLGITSHRAAPILRGAGAVSISTVLRYGLCPFTRSRSTGSLAQSPMPSLAATWPTGSGTRGGAGAGDKARSQRRGGRPEPQRCNTRRLPTRPPSGDRHKRDDAHFDNENDGECVSHSASSLRSAASTRIISARWSKPDGCERASLSSTEPGTVFSMALNASSHATRCACACRRMPRTAR